MTLPNFPTLEVGDIVNFIWGGQVEVRDGFKVYESHIELVRDDSWVGSYRKEHVERIRRNGNTIYEYGKAVDVNAKILTADILEQYEACTSAVNIFRSAFTHGIERERLQQPYLLAKLFSVFSWDAVYWPWDRLYDSQTKIKIESQVPNYFSSPGTIALPQLLNLLSLYYRYWDDFTCWKKPKRPIRINSGAVVTSKCTNVMGIAIGHYDDTYSGPRIRLYDLSTEKVVDVPIEHLDHTCTFDGKSYNIYGDKL